MKTRLTTSGNKLSMHEWEVVRHKMEKKVVGKIQVGADFGMDNVS